MKRISPIMIGSLICLSVLHIGLRLYKLDSPVADWHSWRQVDTASVARIYEKEGVNLLKPRYHDFSNIPSGKDNPEGVRMVEFPVYQAIAVAVRRAVPQFTTESALRIVSIAASLVCMLAVAYIAYAYVDAFSGIFAGLAFAILPYSIYYSRTILPEMTASAFCLVSLLLLDISLARNRTRLAAVGVSAVFAALAMLVKPTVIFFFLPHAVLLIRRFGLSRRLVILGVAYAAISLFPLWWWRTWITQFPEGIPANDWLLNGGNIRFRGAWFYWLFAERIGKLILGYWGALPLGLGLLTVSGKKEGLVIRSFAVSVLLYFIVFARGNVQHDYYQILALPAVSLLVGKGLKKMADIASGRMAGIAAVCAVLAFMTAFSWYTVRTWYWINRPEIVEAGQAADRILPKNAKVIAPYNGDTTFLYQTGRSGWPIGFDIDKKISMGATHYVTVSPTDADEETKALANTYTVLVRNDKFAIIDLTQKQ